MNGLFAAQWVTLDKSLISHYFDTSNHTLLHLTKQKHAVRITSMNATHYPIGYIWPIQFLPAMPEDYYKREAHLITAERRATREMVRNPTVKAAKKWLRASKRLTEHENAFKSS